MGLSKSRHSLLTLGYVCWHFVHQAPVYICDSGVVNKGIIINTSVKTTLSGLEAAFAIAGAFVITVYQLSVLWWML